MRKILILIVFTNTCTLFAQFNNKFCLTGSTWHNYEYYEMAHGNVWWFDEYITCIDSTTIENRMYQHFSMTRIRGGNEPSSDNYDLYLYTKDNKVYKLYSDSLLILYDFTLEVGDTFNVRDANPDNIIEFYVDSVGEIELNEIMRKMIILKDNNNRKIEWIEGIGDIINGLRLFEYDINSNGSLSLQCFTENNVELFGSCNTAINNSNSTAANINLYPNPFSDYLEIESNVKLIENLTLYSINGKVLFKSLNPNSHIRINTKSLLSGQYILKIQINENLFTFKVIKN